MKPRSTRSSIVGSASSRGARIAATALLGLIGLAGAVPPVQAAYTLTLTPTDKKAGEAYQQQQDDPCILGDESCKSPDAWYFPLTNNGGSAAKIDKWSFGPDGKNSPTNIHQWMAAGYLTGQSKTTEVGPFYTFDQLTNVLTCGLITGCAPAAPADSIGFFIGIDTNGSSVPQHLYMFEIYQCAYPLQGTGDKTNLGNTDNCGLFAIFEDPDKTDAAGPNLSDPDTGTGWTNYILSATGMAFTKDHIYAFHAVYDQNGGSDSFFLINNNETPTPPEEVPLPGTLALLGAGLLGLVRVRRVGERRAG